MSRTAALPFHELIATVSERRRFSVYGHISGVSLDRAAPGEAWTNLPYRPVFVGDTERGVLHGGVVTAMLDESCGIAVQLALDGTRAIATLDLRIALVMFSTASTWHCRLSTRLGPDACI